MPKHLHVPYKTEQISYKNQIYLGCVSQNFLADGWQLITLERLFHNHYGESLAKQLYQLTKVEDRLRFLVEQVERLTNLKEFGRYMSRLLTIDALFLNEDRHTHNIAVLMDGSGEFRECPIFDHGAALLSDTTMDYPMSMDVYQAMEQVKAKTVDRDFDEQLDAAEQLYGKQLRFSFTGKDIEAILLEEPHYPEEIKKRMAQVLRTQRKKYTYLFE